MSTARLASVRLVGFKSFAERTTVEFGPGISAVVGPNGSGKSNLADALRWTLGEQGRSLRTRRSEDVIFAGSSSRRAIGMADVTLVIDNQDRLLPVDYGEVEIGRRLYRSGENEYLLNRQKIRLRDLIELLDAGNLADNAFLFIGQGMVDQALALRPEERRPLFEEAAGVRRHERRRRRAEAELAEAETNLDRLRDLLAELRPQARRLAAQAEQLLARRTAGAELADALLAAARARWVALSQSAAREQGVLDRARAAADAALAELRRAEEETAVISTAMTRRADAERQQRGVLDAARGRVVELRLGLARLDTELAGIARDRQRVVTERDAAEERSRQARKELSAPRPADDAPTAAELESVEREVAEMERLRTAPAGARSAPAGTARDLAATRVFELEQVRRRHASHADALADARRRLDAVGADLAAAEAERERAVAILAEAARVEAESSAALETAREALESATERHARELASVASLEAELGAARARLAALEATLAAAVDEAFARAARVRGGRLAAEGLEIDPHLRRAASAALDDALLAYVVDGKAAAALAGRRGTLLVRPGDPSGADVPRSAARAARPGQAAAAEGLLSAVEEAGGGALVAAIRRDPGGDVTRLLERVVWAPDLATALRLAPRLLPGWRCVTVAGDVVGDDGLVRLAAAGDSIGDRAALEQERAAVAHLEEAAAERRASIAALDHRRAAAQRELEQARAGVQPARQARIVAEETERSSQRRAEQLLREVSWQRSVTERLSADAATAAQLVAALEAQAASAEPASAASPGATPGATPADERPAAAQLEERATELRARHQVLAGARSAADARMREWLDGQRRAEVALALDAARLAELDRESERIAARDGELHSERASLTASLADAESAQEGLAAALEKLLSEAADERSRLLESERAAVAARERLRSAEADGRRAEVATMEARLQVEQLREQLLVELAGIGADGLGALEREAGADLGGVPVDERDDGVAADVLGGELEAALASVIEHWRAQGTAPGAPGPGRLATLRRRFHELGAGNPFAAEEHAEVSARLESLENQRTDLESAIASTRELIASLSALITEQFRTTFVALEDAFARRFNELFGGGEAHLSLTAPEDLSTTGVEIHARPPGKKRQPLAMLSGGERALTAVSLLLAMLEVRPVPFCVLDEVDAALDEANIARFSNALRGLADQTQFIVITHNRGTIEGADALYGVTLGDDAVSRVISLRLPAAGSNGKAPDRLVGEASAR